MMSKRKTLSAKMIKVLDFLREGFCKKEACEKAGYSAETVRCRKRKIFDKISAIDKIALDTAIFQGKNRTESQENRPKKKEKEQNIELPIKDLQFGDPASVTLIKMNPRKVRYFAGLAEGKSKKQAAIDAGYSESTALQPSRIEGNTEKYGIVEALEKMGINGLYVARKLKELMEAKNYQKAGYDKNGDPILVEESDRQAISRGLELVMKAMANFAPLTSTKNEESISDEEKARIDDLIKDSLLS